MEYVKQAFLRGIGPLIFMSIAAYFMKKNGRADYKSVFVAGLIITIVAAATIIYEIKEWEFTKQLLVHFLIMLFTVYPLLLISGWFKVNNFLDALKVLAIFILIGILIAAFFYILFTYIIKDK